MPKEFAAALHENEVRPARNGLNKIIGLITDLPKVVPVVPISITGTYRCHIIQMTIETGVNIPNFNNITESVRQIVAESGVQFGTATIYSHHTTAAIKINEHEPLLIEDMSQRLERLFPKDDYYGHNNFDIRTQNMTPEECPNGHSHCQHLLLSTSEVVPVVQGQIALGRWQSIFLVELDRPLKRNYSVIVAGI